MDNNKQNLAYLLSTAIHRERVNNVKLDNINWDVVFRMAKEQDIYSLIYPIIKNIDDDLKPSNEIMSEWKRSTILASIYQSQNINGIGSVLRSFNEAEIQVIALKGLVLRELYPVKELRTMSDSDLLIHIEDLDEARKVLSNLGYVEELRGPKDIVFLHKRFLPIELHWRLLDKERFINIDYIEKNIWKNTKKISICGASVFIPSLENQILYLCLHMASHFMYSGFGLRQLCDLVILVEVHGDEVSWNSLYEKVRMYKIEKFVIAIFEVCRRLFHLNIPEILLNRDLENSKYIDLIIDNVFAGGVYGGIYGTVSWGPVYNSLLPYYEENVKIDSNIGKFKYMIGLFFPVHHRLPERYRYAKEHPMLIPIAWLHRLIHGIFRKNFYMDLKSILLQKQTVFFRKRIDLFKWLGL